MRPIPNLAKCLLVSASVLAFGPFLHVLASDALPRSTPETEGVSSAALIDFVGALNQQIEGMHSVMVVRHGRVVAQGWWAPYAAEDKHVLYSLSKSFTSTAVGFAVAEGKLSIDDEVLKFFPEDAPAEPSANLKAMRIRDLLTMSTGHQDEPPTAPDLVCPKSFLAQPVPHLPGTHFKYNTAATFMLSAIVQKVTGQTVLDYLQPRLFEPLGIEDPVWDKNFQGICLGGYGLRVRTEDIAKLGQLYLQKGRWHDRQLLPADWVEMATSKQTSNGSNPQSDWNQGYGFQFWRCRHHAFRGDGAFGQYCVVMPEQDAVVAITSGVRDMQAVLNVIWDKFLPACHPGELASAPDSQNRLRQMLSDLELPPARGTAITDLAAKVLGRVVVFPANEQKLERLSVVSVPGEKAVTLNLRQDGHDVSLPAGFYEWRKGRGSFSMGQLAQFPDEPIAGTFAWPSNDTFEVRVCAYETPFLRTYRLKFAGDQVTLEQEANVAFGQTRPPALAGHFE